MAKKSLVGNFIVWGTMQISDLGTREKLTVNNTSGSFDSRPFRLAMYDKT